MEKYTFGPAPSNPNEGIDWSKEINYDKNDPFILDKMYEYGVYKGRVDTGLLSGSFIFMTNQGNLIDGFACNYVSSHSNQQIRWLLEQYNKTK